MKALLLSIRTILRFRTYTAINVLGLALSLGCVFVLVRYIHQERTVNHFVPEADRTFLTAVFKEGEPRGSLGESGDRNNDPNYRNPLDHPAVEAFSRFMMFDDDFVTKDDYRYAVNTMVVDSLFFDLISYGCKEGSLQLKPDEALLTPQAALRIFGTEHAVGKELVTSSGKPVRVAGVLKEPSTKSSFQFDFVLSVYLMKDWSRVAYEVVRLHRPEDGDEINRANRTPMKLICYGARAVYYQLVPLKDFYLNRQVSAFADSVTQGRSDVLRLLGLVAGLILLVGLLNYMNLYSVVMLKRGRELGMKKVLGAGKGQIFLQLYAENVCLNAAVVFLAWLLVEVTRRLVDAWFDIPVQGDLRFDLLLSAVVLFLLPLFTMLPPYWRYAHAAPMRSLSQVGVGGKATRSRTVFLFLQYVIAFCLTVAAIYLSRHLQFLLHTDVGYRTEDIIQCPFWKENPAASNNWEIRQQEMKKKNATFASLELWEVKDKPGDEEEECYLCPAGKTHRGVTLVYGNDLWHPALRSATGYPLPHGRRTGGRGLPPLGLARIHGLLRLPAAGRPEMERGRGRICLQADSQPGFPPGPAHPRLADGEGHAEPTLLVPFGGKLE